VVVWSGDPFSVYTRAEKVYIDGALLYDRADPARQPRRDFTTGLPTARDPLAAGPAATPAPSPVARRAAVTPPATGPVAAAARPPQAADTGDVVAITNARILPVSGEPIARGTVVLRGGRIAAVGAAVAVPAGARVIDGTDKVVTPGWIESSTSIGVVEISGSAEGTADQASTDRTVSAAFNVIDAFNPLSSVVPVTRVEGITRAVVAPRGTGRVIRGLAAVVDLAGDQLPQSVTKGPAAMVAALGEAGAGSEGGSRAGALLRLREALQDAADFHRNRVAWNAAQRRPYALGRLDLEALKPVLDGEVPLAIEANRASDLLAAVRLADEFTLKLVLLGAAEGWMVAGELARRQVPVVIKPLTDIPSFDALGATLENAARLQQAGVTLVLTSFDTHNARNLRQEAGNAVAHGLDRDAALRAVTLAPARAWGIADRAGSLDAGKDADVVVWSGDPFELGTAAEHVFIKGREMPSRTRQTALLEKYRRLER
jgi:imidazolonepropionase-like amidohydrolase